MNKSENEFNASEKKIIEALEECTALSLGGLQRQTGMSMRAVANAVRNLEEKGIIKRRATQDGAYYFLAKMTYGQMQNGAVLTNAVVNAKVTNEMLEKEIEQVRGEMKSLYANIISLMGGTFPVPALKYSSFKPKGIDRVPEYFQVSFSLNRIFLFYFCYFCIHRIRTYFSFFMLFRNLQR